MIEEINIAISKKELYAKLKELHQIEFPAAYKLIANYNEDIINNIDYQGIYLNNFVSLLAELDFPTFFVIIKSNYENLARDLQHLNSIHKNGIISIAKSDTVFSIIKEKRETFCVYPWVHFYFNPQGKINACCTADINYPLGDYKINNIDFNSESIQKFRQTLINNEMAPQCSDCYKTEDLGLTSNRLRANKKFAHHIPIDPQPIIDNFKLRYLDIRLSNVCNLKCRMCSSFYSSKIAAEDFKIWGETKFLYDSNSTVCEKKLLQLCTNQINNLETIYFAGGEPLLSDFHYTLLDLLIKYNKTDIHIVYNTNFTIIDKVLDYWAKFSNINVGASIDLYGPQANYVRNGVEYDTIESNYYKLRHHQPHINFMITSVLSMYNVFNLCDLQQHWITDIGLSHEKMSFQLLTNPDNMSITVLPEEIKIRARNRIENHISYLDRISAKKLIHQWKNALDLMNSIDNSHLLKSFFSDNDVRDKARNQIFENYFSEFQNLRQFIKD